MSRILAFNTLDSWNNCYFRNKINAGYNFSNIASAFACVVAPILHWFLLFLFGSGFIGGYIFIAIKKRPREKSPLKSLI